MTGRNIIRVATWNVRHGGSDRVAIAAAVTALEADLVVLTEYRTTPGRGDLLAELAAQGLPHQLHSSPEGRANGVAVASALPLVQGGCAGPPEATQRWVHATVPDIGLEVIGAYVPNWRSGQNGKQEFWDWMLGATAQLADRPTVLAGDWNTGAHYLDENGKTLKCAASFEALSTLGWCDAYRTLHPDGDARSWWSNAGNGFRLDHIFLSPAAQRPTRAEYLVEVGGHRLVRTPGGPPSLSDHAALVVELPYVG